MAEGRTTYQGREARVVLDGDPVVARVRGGFYIFTIARGRPLVQSISDNDLAVENGRATGKGLDTDADNLTGE